MLLRTYWSGGDLAGRSEGEWGAGLPFRDEDCPSTFFAYSTAVTGCNLPRQLPGTSWTFVMAASHQEIPDREETIRRLRRHGFYIVNK
jgi:hypothetical protein